MAFSASWISVLIAACEAVMLSRRLRDTSLKSGGVDEGLGEVSFSDLGDGDGVLGFGIVIVIAGTYEGWVIPGMMFVLI